MTYYNVYLKTDYDGGKFRIFSFTNEADYRNFIAAMEENGNYWGRRVTDKLPDEYLRDSNFMKPIIA